MAYNSSYTGSQIDKAAELASVLQVTNDGNKLETTLDISVTNVFASGDIVDGNGNELGDKADKVDLQDIDLRQADAQWDNTDKSNARTTLNVYSKSDTYTKTEVDNKLKNKIDKYEDDFGMNCETYNVTFNESFRIGNGVSQYDDAFQGISCEEGETIIGGSSVKIYKDGERQEVATVDELSDKADLTALQDVDLRESQHWTDTQKSTARTNLNVPSLSALGNIASMTIGQISSASSTIYLKIKTTDGNYYKVALSSLTETQYNYGASGGGTGTGSGIVIG